jgi:hypothetical protein
MPIVDALGRHRRDKGCQRRVETLEVRREGRAENGIGETLQRRQDESGSICLGEHEETIPAKPCEVNSKALPHHESVCPDAGNTVWINGECTLDKPFTLHIGARLDVRNGAKLWVNEMILQ